MTPAPDVSLRLWQQKRDQYLRELADVDLLSHSAKKDLHHKLLEAQQKIRFYKQAVDLESTKAEIAEMKALAKVDLA